MCFRGRAAAHKPKITMRSAKLRLEWCKAHRHWTLEQWKRVLWAFFATKVEREGKEHHANTSAFERVSCANRNCMDSYPTFLAVLWCAGLCLNQAPAAFAGLVYLVARQKYFIGYMGQTSQSTPGYVFGKRVLSFLFLMCIVGIFNLLLVRYFGNDFKDTVETITTAASALLLIP
ncbi:arachidonate 5-lipoxygenase-activating protein-like isoform X1 [Oncorhynchus keta]|uniref:arachidonate 5-lipoxygenase-activating protein-like isoform X1 n=1 Tax=Oncorhynchus keta TaxID=8018 RepID=UPI00227B554D|nr:arachidonate 5-lipoxygenase-activating protein-like isoform X1 [Oncorhynchus keta]